MQGGQDRPARTRRLARPAVWGLLFALALVFFDWPMMSAYLDAPLFTAHVYLFLIWLLIVAGLFLVCRAVRQSRDDEGQDEG